MINDNNSINIISQPTSCIDYKKSNLSLINEKLSILNTLNSNKERVKRNKINSQETNNPDNKLNEVNNNFIDDISLSEVIIRK